MNEPRTWVRRYFPIPLVSVVVLLVVLIFLTPNLNPSGTAGSLPTEAELIVDRVASSNVTHLYVRPIGTVRYASITLGVDPNVTWFPMLPLANLTYPVGANQTDTLGISYATIANPIAVSISALYRDSAGNCVLYSSVYAFQVRSLTLYSLPLAPPGTEDVVGLGDLPYTVLLNSVALGPC
jgi:hypothetical protein